MNAGFRIGRTQLGERLAPLFLPDIDVYFKSDMALALGLVDALAEAGAVALKGAVLHDARLASAEGDTSYFVPGKGMVTERYRDILERHVVPLADLRRILRHASDAGLDIVLSVYDETGLAFAQDCGSAALKIPSSNIVHAPLIRKAAAAGVPLILDTGRSTMDEIARAVRWARSAGGRDLLIEHSPPGPPAGAEHFHLRMMRELGRRHDTLCGLSDHCAGTDMIIAAVALGAHVVEKGVCADGTQTDIDIAHALPISQAASLLSRIDAVHKALGESERVLPADRPAPADRMGLVAARDLKPGRPLTLADVRFAFPAIGVRVEHWDTYSGRVLARPVRSGEPIRSEDFRPED